MRIFYLNKFKVMQIKYNKDNIIVLWHSLNDSYSYKKIKLKDLKIEKIVEFYCKGLFCLDDTKENREIDKKLDKQIYSGPYQFKQMASIEVLFKEIKNKYNLKMGAIDE